MGSSASNFTYRYQTAGGIPYRLMAGYPKLGGDRDSTTATEKYIISAANVRAFFLESFPPPVVLGNFISTNPRRRMPGAGLVTESVEFEPFQPELPGDPFNQDPGATAGTFSDQYVATINYKAEFESEDNEPDENDPESFLEISVSAAGEFLSIPQTNTKAEDNPTEDSPGYSLANAASPDDNHDIHQATTKLIPTMEISARWKYAIAPHWENILNQLGTLNVKKYPLLLSSEIETCMFMGVSASRRYLWGANGVIISPWTIDFKFSIRRIEEPDNQGVLQVYGWNHFYRPKTGKWMRVKRANGEPVYQKSDFDLLFRAP